MRARKLDPNNALYPVMHAMFLQYLRRWDEILAMGIPGQMQYAYIAKGMRKEQLADQRLRVARNPERLAAFERGLAEGGYEGAQRAIADLLASQYEKNLPNKESPSGVALRYFDAGDKDRAIDWLYKGYADHDPNMVYIGIAFLGGPLAQRRALSSPSSPHGSSVVRKLIGGGRLTGQANDNNPPSRIATENRLYHSQSAY